MKTSCKFCKTKPVWQFTNKRTICKKHFIEYFEKKVSLTMTKYSLINNKDKLFIEKHKNSKICEFVLKKLLENKQAEIINQKNKSTKKVLSASLDENASSIIRKLSSSGINKQNLPLFKQKNKKIIQPFYLMLDKEIELYSKINNLVFSRKKDKNKVFSSFLENIDNKGENKAAIINSYLAIFN